MAPSRTVRDGGFTLLETLVAMVILAMIVTHFLGTRTSALVDAAEARNKRIAREIAEQYLSELQAGMRDPPPDKLVQVDLEDYPGFSYRIVIGESRIADVEGDLADAANTYAPDGLSPTDRRAWQRERENIRRAQAAGMSMMDYEDQLREEELDERIPTEDEFEEVAIIVTYPNVRPGDEFSADFSTFTLKARLSTMAIECLTPENAAIVAEQRGGSEPAAEAVPALPGVK